jgi:hypothetical protein
MIDSTEDINNFASETAIKRLLEAYQNIIKELRLHTNERNCRCKVSDLLRSLEFESDE